MRSLCASYPTLDDMKQTVKAPHVTYKGNSSWTIMEHVTKPLITYHYLRHQNQIPQSTAHKWSLCSACPETTYISYQCGNNNLSEQLYSLADSSTNEKPALLPSFIPSQPVRHQQPHFKRPHCHPPSFNLKMFPRQEWISPTPPKYLGSPIEIYKNHHTLAIHMKKSREIWIVLKHWLPSNCIPTGI